MSCRRPAFLVRNNNTSSYFFRSVIPLDLRPKFNDTREFRISLKTGILSEAQRISSQLKFEADIIFNSIRCGNISGTCVASIKEQLKNLRDRLLLIKMKGGGSEVENLRPAKINGTPSELFRKMELSKEDLLRMQKAREEKEELEEAKKLKKSLKLVKSYYHRFSYEDVLRFCEEYDIEPTEELFPKRYVRKCRRSIVEILEESGYILEEAEDIALEVIEAHIDSLSQKEFVEFFSETNIPDRELKDIEDKEDLLTLLEIYGDSLAMALKIGVDIAFAVEPEREEEEKEAPAKEKPKETTGEILCRNWKRLYMPPPNKPSLSAEEKKSATEAQPENLANAPAEKKSDTGS